MPVKTTLVINFEAKEDEDLTAVAMLDDDLNKTTSGDVKTQFAVSDKPYFLVHLDPALVVDEVRCSSGSALYRGVVTRNAEMDSVDADEDGDTADLEHIPESNPTFTWYGNSPAVGRNGRTLTFDGPNLPATGRATYQYRAHSYQYTPPSLAEGTEWRTRIVIKVRRK